MRVFVAGGTGAVGRHLIPALIADGHQVTVVQAIRCVVNPDKLRHLGPVSELAREAPPETR